ncbi:MAG: PadR family transcriptional regulator, regulatory protein PadR [Rubrobacteraceae bacterium]|jgi:PadR family transcriptional regulator PadR|nr:PadR family transcriptional regulator, regulatory protein PadR [Rubrobacteraceae bacterium]
MVRQDHKIGARPRNWLVPVLLLLSLCELNSYGYEHMVKMTALGFGALNPGTLYRTLRQMEKALLRASGRPLMVGLPAGCIPLPLLEMRI